MIHSKPMVEPKLTITDKPASESADVLVIGYQADGTMSSTMTQLDQVTGGLFQRLIDVKEIVGKKYDSLLIAIPDSSDNGPNMCLVVGLGTESPSTSTLFDVAATAIRKLANREREKIVIALADDTDDAGKEAVVAGAVFGCEGQAIYKTEHKGGPSEITFAGISGQNLSRGATLGESINVTRRLVNEPPAVIYPESFADASAKIAKDAGLEIEIWNEKKLEAENCRAILAVGAGSEKESRIVILKHHGGGDEPPIAIVGKGVTFDSGGLSIKPSEGMLAMKCDMAGAATVVGVMQAIAKLGVKRNVIGFCGLAENMISGSSYKLGDVIETRSGKTIEIHNTDAEGRVVLADTLDVAIEHEPSSMIDLATLTGACMVALGNEVAGLMSNNDALCESIVTAANQAGEPVWQLPMFELYDEKVKSEVADIKNVGEGRWGGAITAAKFLQNFVGDVPWVHIDIAGPAFADSPKPYRDAGATGVMVRTLVKWIENGN